MNDRDEIESRIPESSPRRTKQIVIRGTLILLALVGIVLNSIFGYALPNSNVDCVQDYIQEGLSKGNDYFYNNPVTKNIILIASSLFIDFIMLALGLVFFLYSTSTRLILSLSTFYFFKFIVNLINQLRIPNQYIWENPGFPSIMVSYLRTNTFFFSTTIGFLTIAIFEFGKMKQIYLMCIATFLLVIETFILLIMRGNYIIDILSAFVIAHFIFMIADEYSYLIDRLFGIDNSKTKEEQKEQYEILYNVDHE
jgi:hypothetical protein